MQSAPRLSVSSLAGLALALAGCGAPGTPRVQVLTEPHSHAFDGAAGDELTGWRVGTSNAEAGHEDGRWEIVADDTAPSPPGAAGLVDAKGHEGQEFNLCWDPERQVADVDVTVSVRALEGREDQGGGPAWRITGVNDYYAARWNPLEDNFRVYSVQGGVRQQLDSARVRTDPGTWHVIRVRHVGASITCWFDGEELLHAEDAKLPGPGAVGLWTKADALTWFDDLRVAPAD